MSRDQKLFDAIKEITHEFGPYFQAQNDYLDIYDEKNLLNKPGHDIEIGKFSWCATIVMTHGTEQQKDVMRKCYGKKGNMK